MRDADIAYASFEVCPNLLAAQGLGAYWHTAFPRVVSRTFWAFPARGADRHLYPARPSSVSLYEHTTRFTLDTSLSALITEQAS